MADPRPPASGTAFDTAPILTLELDADGLVCSASQRWTDLLRRPAASLLGTPFVEDLTPSSVDSFNTTLLPCIAAGQPVEDLPLVIRRPDGSEVPVLVSTTSTAWADGPRARAFLVDMSGMHGALAALERKASEAEEASLAKSRFLAAMSHEIRTPMNAILGFAQLLDRTDLDATRRGHVQAILSAGKGLMALLSDLLDLSQVEAGHMRIEIRTFALRPFVEEVAQFWWGAAADNGLTLNVTIDDDLPERVASDPLRLRQVLNNLLGNAVKFTPSGEIGLSVSRVADQEARLRFRVTDTGPGIHPDDVARLFAPFVQAQGDMAGGTGWGLGLSICQNIAAVMDARLHVDSAPGQGAAFVFDVPIADPVEAPTPAPTPSPKTRPLRLLLAEDEALNQQVMEQMLTGLGHSVVSVTNGFEAVSAAAASPFDAVIMDVMMPGLDGIAATKRIRSATGGSAPAIIGCSAHVTAEDRALYAESGMAAFLPKPVDRDALARVLADVVGDGADAAS